MTKKLSSETIKSELKRREELRNRAKVYDIHTDLFDKQLDFILDPSRNKIAVCSRRAGKSHACAADLIYTAVNNPKVVCLYITLSRASAKKIVWRELLEVNKNFKLGGVSNNAELSITFPNGSIIYLSGAKDSSEIEKFRGLALKLVYIDEAQSFRSHLENLINDVLSPALMDHSGTLCLIGTPGPIPAGFFYDCDQDPDLGWSRHHWTFFNNPHLLTKSGKTHEQMLEYEVRRRGVTADDASIQREFFGRWVSDNDSLLIKYNEDINDYDELPEIPMEYVMGIDFGYNDADAIAVLAWSKNSPVTYLVEEMVVPHQGITELVDQISALQTRYNVSKFIADEGALGKKIAEEIRRRHHIPLVGADKTRKMENIAFLNDALRTGRMLAKADSRFAEDSQLVEVDLNRSTPDRIKVSDRYHSDIIDAVLYAFKESPSYAYMPPPIVYPQGHPKWGKQEEDKMFEAAREYFRKQEEDERGNPWDW